MTGTTQAQRVDSILADMLCLPTAAHPLPQSARGRLTRRVVAGAAEFLDDSRIVEQVEQWRAADRAVKGPGGRQPTLTDRASLVVLLALVLAGEDPLISRVAEAISCRLHTDSRTMLGLPPVQHLSESAIYHRVYRSLHRFVQVIDSAPGTPGKRLTYQQVQQIKAQRDRDQQGVKHQRLLWVTNQLLETSFRRIPEEMRNAWNGSIAVDATVVPVFGKSGSPTKTQLRERPGLLMSPEIDAAWYHRDADHRDTPDGRGRRNPKSIFGYEAHLAVMSRDTPKRDPNFPLLVLAMSVDRPAGRVAENALTMAQSIVRRGHPSGMFIGDRAYFPNPRAANLQLPLRELGYTICGDYKVTELGIQGQSRGALLLEGSWYCPSIPQILIDATKDFRTKRIDEEQYRKLIGQRVKYAFRRKDGKVTGKGVYFCPARGPRATAACPLAQPATGPVTLTISSKRPATTILNLPAHPDKCCTNLESVSLDDTDEHIAKYRQHFAYESPEWVAMYRRPRNTIEGYNALTKSPTDENLAEPARRRVRGLAFQTLLIAVLITATNIRKIGAFIEKTERGDHNPTSPRRGRPSTRRSYLPDPQAPPLVTPAA